MNEFTFWNVIICSCYCYSATSVFHTTVLFRALQVKWIRTTVWGVYKVHTTVTEFWDETLASLFFRQFGASFLEESASDVWVLFFMLWKVYLRVKFSGMGEHCSLAVHCSVAAVHLVMPEWHQQGLSLKLVVSRMCWAKSVTVTTGGIPVLFTCDWRTSQQKVVFESAHD